MKGFNMKKLAALGIGAAMVGSALAPVVSAATYNNMDSLEESDVVNDAGVPVVDVVVGSNAAVSDVVWGGNIATRIAQLATTPASGGDANGETTVDYTVGGTTTLAGEGNEDKNTLGANASDVEFNPIQIDNGYVDSLADKTDVDFEVEDVDQNAINIKETIEVDVDAAFQSEGDGILAGQLVGSIDQNDIRYLIDFTGGTGPGIPFYNDSNDSDLQIPFLGDTWNVASVAENKVVLKSDEISEKVRIGDSVTVNGIGDYEGKELEVVLTDVAVGSEGDQYEAEFELRDGDTVVEVVSGIEDNEDLQNELEDYTDTALFVDVVRQSIDDEVSYVRLNTGDQQIVLEDNKEFEDDGNDDADKYKVDIGEDGSNVTSIMIYNDDLTYAVGDADADDLQEEGTSDAYKMGPLEVGSQIDLFDQEEYKYVFQGFEEADYYSSMIGTGDGLNLRIDGAVRNIPLYLGEFNNGDDVVEIGGRKFTLYADGDRNIFMFDGEVDNPEDKTDQNTDGITIDVSGADWGVTNAISFDIERSGFTSTLDYNVLYNQAADDDIDYMLVLSANQELDIDVDGTYPDLNLSGTTVPVEDSDTDLPDPTYDTVPYYLPFGNGLVDDIVDLGLTVPADTNVDANVDGSVNDKYYATFLLADRPTTGLSETDATVYVDTENGKLVDTDDDYPTNLSAQVSYGIYDLDEADDEDALLSIGSTYGAAFQIADSVLTATYPDQATEVVSWLGSYDTTEEVEGGDSYEEVAVGEEEGGVTVDAINAPSGAGVSVVASGDLLTTDTEYAGGRAVIVGGYVANSAAVDLTVMEGQTLEDLLQADGDYVAYVLDSGSTVVAGKNAEDTGSAASALINALEDMM